ncbi:MAG: nuclear transport factor 2 family protein [Chitinophaga rupis]
MKKFAKRWKAGIIKNLPRVFDADGVYQRPFALKGTPSQYTGATKIHDYIEAGMAAANKLFEIINLEVETHPCIEDNVVFVEFFLSGKSMATSETFRIASSAALISFKDGKIIQYRDFPNSAGIAQAAGTLQQYAASLTK